MVRSQIAALQDTNALFAPQITALVETNSLWVPLVTTQPDTNALFAGQLTTLIDTNALWLPVVTTQPDTNALFAVQYNGLRTNYGSYGGTAFPILDQWGSQRYIWVNTTGVLTNSATLP